MESAAHILVVDDDLKLRNLLARYLTEHGFIVATAGDAADARGKLANAAFDLIVLDLMMPGESGLNFAAGLRRASAVPILMLTAMGEPEDRIAGLERGADDYLTKPFAFEELVARVRALLRRGGPTPPSVLQLADLRLDPMTREVTRAGTRIDLTAKEYALLEFFLRRAGQVLSRAVIAHHVWGVDFDTFTNVIDVYVNYLRKKIDADFDPKLLHTVRGVGYVLKEPAH
jgi:DNA-binding response OmpR family regulator